MRRPPFIKQIADPIHGSVGLTELETKIISSPVFLRLRNVRQLGLVYYVYPGADYSRFSHSVGVCHVTGLILDSLSKAGCEVTETEWIEHRLAGLLHDVGHYPFSHAFEHVVGDLYPGVGTFKTGETKDEDGKPAILHEQVGELILENDPEISRLLKESEIDPAAVSGIFTRKRKTKFTNLVSSDLDADRIDYLLRTSHHTGLPYGHIDLKYLLTQVVMDNEGRVCLTPKALRTAEHFLLSRYFDYQQVSYHKTVVGFELILKNVLKTVLKELERDFTASGIAEQIRSKEWRKFDDFFLLRKMAECEGASADGPYREKLRAVLERRPLALVYADEFLGNRDGKSKFEERFRVIRGSIKSWADAVGIDAQLWFAWNQSGTALTKIGSRIPVDDLSEPDTVNKATKSSEQSIRIRTDNGESISIVDEQRSLMSRLAQDALFSTRIYCLLPAGKDRREVRAKIKELAPLLFV
jgi:uncharacterized protein